MPAALLTSIALGAAQVTNEVTILAVLIVGTVAGGLWLARLCATDGKLLLLFLGVILLHPWLLVRASGMGGGDAARADAELALLGDRQPARDAAARADARRRDDRGKRFGVLGFGVFALLALVLVTDNRFGSDGGGAIVLGVAFAFLGARTLRLGARGFAMLLRLGATSCSASCRRTSAGRARTICAARSVTASPGSWRSRGTACRSPTSRRCTTGPW